MTPQETSVTRSRLSARSLSLILASSSPRRRELLSQAGYDFQVIPPDPDAEGNAELRSRETPAELVIRLAHAKGSDVARRTAEGIVVACDTVAECDGQILGKPTGRDDARRMLEQLRGREHRVWSGLCVWPRPGDVFDVEAAQTVLRMISLTDREIDEYLATGLWQGKAGGFGLQDRLGWIEIVAGSPSNVVGLPLELLAEMLAGIGQR